MIAFFLAASLSVLVHELGHASMQRLFGLPVARIEWGVGPLFLKIGVLEIRWIPFAGGVTPVGSKLTPSRIKGAWIAGAGVIAQWMAVLLLAVTQLHQHPWMKNFALSFLFFAIMSLTQLLPFDQRDGYYMWQSLRGAYSKKASPARLTE